MTDQVAASSMPALASSMPALAGFAGGESAFAALTERHRRELHERALLASFIEAHERGDAALAVSIASQDLRITMPPAPMLFEGLAAIAPLLERAISEGSWRLLPTVANRMPTAASYLKIPGDSVHRAFKLDVLRIADGRIAEITTFGPGLFAQFGLPETLED